MSSLIFTKNHETFQSLFSIKIKILLLPSLIMSTDSLALLRKNASDDIRQLAEDHYKHDLSSSNQETLKSAVGKIGTHATIGSARGLGLGIFLAFRIRRNRVQMFNAFRTTEKATHAKFGDGREGESFLGLFIVG